MQRGHGSASLPVTNVCDRSGSLSCAWPVVALIGPPPAAPKVFRTQVEVPWFAIGSGGPNQQFGVSTHAPATPSQSASDVHEIIGWAGKFSSLLMQLLPGPAARVQVRKSSGSLLSL